ncbi:PaaI family thioesterase [Gammaproteobacteria bacterium]|nr:PaaI family thioesterase [Gammaproteobacteria bacterium]
MNTEALGMDMDILEKLKNGSAGPSMRFFNLKYENNDNEVFRFSALFPQDSANPMGFVQGGMISAVLDDATSVVMISGYKGKKAPLTTDLHVLFHRPMPLGRANIEVKIIKLGNRSATAEGRIYSTDNKLVATLLHSAQPVDRPPQ